MTPAEAVILVRYVRALCPQQKFDEYTPDAWHDLLGHYDFDACKTAAVQLARRQPFIAPAELITEVRRERDKRLANFQYEPENGDDHPREYLRRLRAQIADVADGRRPAELTPGGPRTEVGELLGRHLRTIDEEEP